MSRAPSPPLLDFGVLRGHLDPFIKATGNRIEREWPKHVPQHAGSAAIVLGIYRLAEMQYWATRYLLADTPAEAARRKEFALVTSPLVRSLVEWLAAVIYLFEDLEARTVEFLKAGWRAGVMETERLRRERGSNQAWQPVIEARTRDLRAHYTRFGIALAEANDVERKLLPWPRVGTIVKRLKGPRGDYARYLNDWFYGPLSEHSHPTWVGVSRARPLILDRAQEQEIEARLDYSRSKQVCTVLALILAIATELDRELGFGDGARAKYAWSILREWDPDIADFYDSVYLATLGPATIAKL